MTAFWGVLMIEDEWIDHCLYYEPPTGFVL